MWQIASFFALHLFAAARQGVDEDGARGQRGGRNAEERQGKSVYSAWLQPDSMIQCSPKRGYRANATIETDPSNLIRLRPA